MNTSTCGYCALVDDCTYIHIFIYVYLFIYTIIYIYIYIYVLWCVDIPGALDAPICNIP